VTRERRDFTLEYDTLLTKLWRTMPPLSVRQIAELMGCTERRVRARACALRRQGVDLVRRETGHKLGAATPMTPEDWPAPQPVTVARRAGDMLMLRVSDSVADWRFGRFGKSVMVPLDAPRPRHLGTFRGLTACGAASPWLSVVPSAADGARFDGRGMGLVLGGSPAGQCADLGFPLTPRRDGGRA